MPSVSYSRLCKPKKKKHEKQKNKKKKKTKFLGYFFHRYFVFFSIARFFTRDFLKGNPLKNKQ
jgi:hypothetical protein